ncbi:LacI family DNA-binding transcriptional regulator [Deinococcus sp.]|uniref:LacI family DNA-binding transcriptional regulator n=1 Tax=Deinococcus sp. TaxID=47478 RepID=UPI003B590AA7
MRVRPTSDAPLTLNDVARHAGVSPMTVSNVINGKAGVRPATKARVLAAIEATGYRVNQVARALAGGRSRMLSVFTPQLNRPYATEVVQGAAQAADELHYDLVVMMLAGPDAAGSPAPTLSVVTRLAVGALLIQPSRGGRWEDADLPDHIVSVDGPGPHQLNADNYGGACLATAHLLSLGHTRIGFISGQEAEGQLKAASSPEATADDPTNHDRDDDAQRLRGYRESLAAAGLNVPEGYMQHGDYSKASGERAARALLNLPNPPTAIFVAGDAMALGAIHVAQDMGLAVPRDLSVVGFDDLPIAGAARPGLTTVRQPLALMGEVGVRQLVALAEGQPVPPTPPFVTELIVRESTAAPRVEGSKKGRSKG